MILGRGAGVGARHDNDGVVVCRRVNRGLVHCGQSRPGRPAGDAGQVVDGGVRVNRLDSRLDALVGVDLLGLPGRTLNARVATEEKAAARVRVVAHDRDLVRAGGRNLKRQQGAAA